jgi:hypothetical protein
MASNWTTLHDVATKLIGSARHVWLSSIGTVASADSELAVINDTVLRFQVISLLVQEVSRTVVNRTQYAEANAKVERNAVMVENFMVACLLLRGSCRVCRGVELRC